MMFLPLHKALQLFHSVLSLKFKSGVIYQLPTSPQMLLHFLPCSQSCRAQASELSRDCSSCLPRASL